ncbi:hypothetical protein ACHAW6_009794 [Cyclotella cf. meneghiniana]
MSSNVDSGDSGDENRGQDGDAGSDTSSVVNLDESLFQVQDCKHNEDAESTNEAVFDYDNLDISDEIKELFKHIDVYEPIDLELETPLKCFIPPYIPAVGEVDPMIKIPRPDGVPDGIGITVLDEIIMANQSNPAVIELQLRNWSKTKESTRLAVRSIANAAKCPQEIDEWIQSVEEIHEKEQPFAAICSDDEILRLKELMKPWPKDFQVELQKSNVGVPSPDIDLSLSEYARVLCSLYGIPVRDGSLIDSVHMMFRMYLEYCRADETRKF